MATRVRCLKCSKIIECSPYDATILLEHVRTEHPEIELLGENDKKMETKDANTSFHSLGQSRPPAPVTDLPPVGDKMEEETVRHPGEKPMYTRRYKVRSPMMAKSPQRRRMYRTSVEKWRPAKGTIYCPRCGVNKKPIIRSRTEKMSYSTIGAACILTCWPLCFLPCLFPSPTKDYLHCAECNNFLGMYDKQHNCVRPNREFVEGGAGCESAAKPENNLLGDPSEQTADENLLRVHPEGIKVH